VEIELGFHDVNRVTPKPHGKFCVDHLGLTLFLERSSQCWSNYALRLEKQRLVHKFLNKMRVRHAETLLLDSQLPVNAVASESGFATGQHFARIFKQVNGLQPLEFRRRHRRA